MTFGKVENRTMILNEIGKIVEKCLLNLPEFCLHLEIYNYVVMPNHIHIIFVLNKNNENGGQTGRSVPTKYKSISEITKNFKTFTSRLIHEKYPSLNFSWQRSFYDHVVRCDESLEKIQTYILNNPLKWEYDRNNPNRKFGKYHFEF
jgi:REP element-mobilizing transposase RayT